MTKYDQGRRFEWKTRDDLTPNGYEVVRAAGSKGGTKIDLIAIKPGQLLFIQCKEDGKLGPAEWDRVYEVAGWVGAIPLLAANGPRGRGVVYTRLLGPKIPRARTQPCEPFLLDEIAAAGVACASRYAYVVGPTAGAVVACRHTGRHSIHSNLADGDSRVLWVTGADAELTRTEAGA